MIKWTHFIYIILWSLIFEKNPGLEKAISIFGGKFEWGGGGGLPLLGSDSPVIIYEPTPCEHEQNKCQSLVTSLI